jgi:hypothetical protein
MKRVVDAPSGRHGSTQPERSHSCDTHAELVELIAPGDVGAACQNLRSQRDRAGKDLLDSLARVGLTQF